MMAEIGKVLRAERMKLRRRRSTWIVPALVALMTFLVFLAAAITVSKNFAGIPSGFYLASSVTGWMIKIAGLLAMMLTCFQISGEFSLGTVKPAWVRGLSRQGWFAGKAVSAAAAVTFLFLVIVTVSLAGAGAKYGFSALAEKDYVIHPAAALWKGYVLCAALTLFSLWSAVAVTAMLAAYFNRPGSAIAVSVLLAAGLAVLEAAGPARPFLLTSSISMPFEQMTAMSKGLPLPLEWTELVWKSLACAGGWLVVAFVAGNIIISRKEITF